MTQQNENDLWQLAKDLVTLTKIQQIEIFGLKERIIKLECLVDKLNNGIPQIDYHHPKFNI